MTSKLRFLALAALAAAGCGGPPTSQVSGTVALDGKPVKSGAIEFFPTGAGGRSAGGAITGGYAVTGTPGAMRVTVYSAEVIGKQKMYDAPDSPVEDVVKNTIPAKYNTASELTADFKEGDNKLDFDLKSGAK